MEAKYRFDILFVEHTHLLKLATTRKLWLQSRVTKKRLGLTCRRSRALTAVLLPLAVTTGQWYETVSSARHPCVWYSRWGDAVNTRAPAYQELFVNYWIVSLSPLVTLLLLWHLSPSTLLMLNCFDEIWSNVTILRTVSSRHTLVTHVEFRHQNWKKKTVYGAQSIS